ncbi:hypothetical protein [Haloechinothrix sp. LS1_15]|uniref:hypothetical protein n=1 Tax=Haloechinothrix sp. LS1_15 TaxID=2652248 RepID=UPI00294651E4|nr:hypothetical protein [Haloechinothrix sp. LS1_15]MDV6014016.1 hypothetical protein [Haloechinothrix sp. LS1_15]
MSAPLPDAELRARCVWSPEHARLREAAVDYAAHGWGVIPGAACDGLRYLRGHTGDPAPGLVPVLRGARTLRDPRRVWHWWSLAPYSILARAGEQLTVLYLPVWLATATLTHASDRGPVCPVMLGPHGAALVITPGIAPPAGIPDLAVAQPGELIPLPPTRTLAGTLTWHIHPNQTGWQPGPAEHIYTTATTTLAERMGRS